MTWKKRLIIALGLMLLSHVAEARRIEKFTDSQGTLHITNFTPIKPENSADSSNPGAASSPTPLRNTPPVPPRVGQVVPEPPDPEPETPQEPEPGIGPVEPQPSSRVTNPGDSGGVG